MASIEVATLSHNLEDKEAAELMAVLREADINVEGAQLDGGDDSDAEPRFIDAHMDDDLFADLVDQLDANDAACDIYMPMDFEDIIEYGEYRVGSSYALTSVLDDIRDELFDGGDQDSDDHDSDDQETDEYDDSPDDFDEFGPATDVDDDVPGVSTQLKDDQMRALWKAMMNGARTSIRENLCLFVRR